MPDEDEGPTLSIIIGSLAVIMFLVGLAQSLWWLWEQTPWGFAILVAFLIASLSIRTFHWLFNP